MPKNVMLIILDNATESVINSTTYEQIVEDYKILSDKMDKIIGKIRCRKEKKKQEE